MTAGGFITAIESASTARGDDDRQVISWTSDFNFEPITALVLSSSW